MPTLCRLGLDAKAMLIESPQHLYQKSVRQVRSYGGKVTNKYSLTNFISEKGLQIIDAGMLEEGNAQQRTNRVYANGEHTAPGFDRGISRPPGCRQDGARWMSPRLPLFIADIAAT